MRIKAKHLTVGPRFLAVIIDLLVLLLILSPLIALETYFGAETPKLLLISSAILGGCVSHIYNLYFHGRYGQTLGKMATKVKVVTVAEDQIGYREAFLRDLPYIIFSSVGLGFDIYEIVTLGSPILSTTSPWNFPMLLLLAFCVADILAMLASDKRRSLHDHIGGTVVVRTNV